MYPQTTNVGGQVTGPCIYVGGVWNANPAVSASQCVGSTGPIGAGPTSTTLNSSVLDAATAAPGAANGCTTSPATCQDGVQAYAHDIHAAATGSQDLGGTVVADTGTGTLRVSTGDEHVVCVSGGSEPCAS